jgi:hypothetical protein
MDMSKSISRTGISQTDVSFLRNRSIRCIALAAFGSSLANPVEDLTSVFRTASELKAVHRTSGFR